MSGLELMARASLCLATYGPSAFPVGQPHLQICQPQRGLQSAVIGPASSNLEIKDLRDQAFATPSIPMPRTSPGPACHPSSKGAGGGVLAPGASSATVTQPKRPFILVVSSRGPRVPLMDLA